MRGRLPTALAVLTLFLAGCVTPPVDVDASSDDAAAAADAFTLYLTGAPGLTWDAPTADTPEEVGAGAFFTQWGEGDAFAEFTGAPANASLLITEEMTLHLHARADGPAVQAGVFPHFVASFGTTLPDFGDAPPAFNVDGAADAEPVLVDGDVIRFEITLTPPRDGFLIEKGAVPRVLVTTVMTQDARTGDVTFLVNGTNAPSRVAFTAARVPDPPEPRSSEGAPADGRLVGSAYAGRVDGASTRAYPVDVPADAARVTVGLAARDGAGFPDVDLEVTDAAGEVVARGVTPRGEEGIVLYPVHTGDGGAFTVHVINYGSATVSYTVDIRVWDAV